MDTLSRAVAMLDVAKLKPVAISRTYTKQISKESESSVQIYVRNDIREYKTDKYEETEVLDVDKNLEQKLDKMTELLIEQRQVFSNMRKETRRSNVAVQHTVDTYARLASELLHTVLSDRSERLEVQVDTVSNGKQSSVQNDTTGNPFMAALDIKHQLARNNSIKDALDEILDNDIFLEKLSSCTAAAVKTTLEDIVVKEICSSLAVNLETYQQKLLSDIGLLLNDALGSTKLNLNREPCRTIRGKKQTLERRAPSLEDEVSQDPGLTTAVDDVVRPVFEKVVSKWRLELFSPSVLSYSVPTTPSDNTDAPLDPISPVGKFMNAARSNIKLKEGDVNGCFETALCACDTTLVVAACKAVDPARVFGPPCLLHQSVLLSLIQQLTTDVMLDTDLKCRYIEEAIMNLDKDNQGTVSHIPLVFTDVKHNLRRFLNAHPHHVYRRRLGIILMVADFFLTNDLASI